jgi:hypothetical protein
MSCGVSSYIANGSDDEVVVNAVFSWSDVSFLVFFVLLTPERVLTKGTLDILVFVPSSLFTQKTGAYKRTLDIRNFERLQKIGS